MPIHFVLVVGTGEKLVPSSLALILCRIWEERGHATTITSSSPERSDCALLHINTTTIDPNLLPTFEPGIPVLNGCALDISKRLVSRNLVLPEDGYTGQVIVKTDDNFHGIPKWPRTHMHDAAINCRRQVTLDNWRSMRMLPLGTYPVLKNKNEVPDWVWSRLDIVVERFIPEMEGDLYVLRLWVFLGQREFGIKVYGRNPIVKSGDRERYEFIDEVPDDLRFERQRLGFDFGKFDYIMHEGKAILLDANKTPTVSNTAQTPAYAVDLAKALSDMFPGRY